MSRNERRARERQQAKDVTALHRRVGRARSAAEAVEAAQRLFQLGRIKEALPGLRQAAAAFPGDADVRGALGYAFAATGLFRPAIEQYQALLQMRSDSAPVLTNLAHLFVKTGDIQGALGNLERASKLDPTHANTAFALAQLLDRMRRKDEAFRHYRRAADLFLRKVGPNPEVRHCDDLVKLATAQLWIGDLVPGLRNLERAVDLRPDHVLAHARRGLALAKLRRVPESIEAFKRAAALRPDYGEVRHALADALLIHGDEEGAERQYRAATKINPGDEIAKFFLAATRHESPDAPPPAYVQNLFDDYAQHFEHHLVDVLQYRAPEQVCAALLELAGSDAKNWSVIDLGCGTGLCGPLIRHAARRLVGVDLSIGMLDKARQKSVYDDLRLGDVAQVLAGYRDEFDLALCTDVMIYLGSLTPIFAAAAGALKEGALFAFTTEVHPGEGFVVDKSGRYLHSREYVESTAAAHGLIMVHFEPIVARYEHMEPDIHHLFIARRAAA